METPIQNLEQNSFIPNIDNIVSGVNQEENPTETFTTNTTETPTSDPFNTQPIENQTETTTNSFNTTTQPIENPIETPTENTNPIPETPIENSATDSGPLSQIKSPIMVEKQSVLLTISPAKFDTLLKTLQLMVDSNDPIIIKNSQITRSIKSGIVFSDIKQLFDGQNINLHIVNPRKYIKLFESFKNNNNIAIVDDDENSRYVVLNGEVRLFLPKQDDSIKEHEVQMPELSGAEGIGKIDINKETKSILKKLSKDAEYIEYLFQDSKLKGIHIPETAIYIFEEFIGDEKASKLDETNAELMLQSTAFLPIVTDDYNIVIAKLQDGTYFSYTTCKCGVVDVIVYEELENTTGGNIF